MKTKHWLPACLAAALGTAATLALPGQDDEAAMMARMMEYMTPGEAHEVLDHKVGRWDCEVKMFMAPGAPPQVSEATAEYAWILDRRYLTDETTGDFGGMPFHGRGLTGYDNMKKKYVATWIDNTGTGIMYTEGTYDAEAKRFTFEGEAPDVIVGKIVHYRTTETILGDGHWRVEVYKPGLDGGEFKSMEIDYKRAR